MSRARQGKSILCPCKSKIERGTCAYHGWYSEYAINKRVAAELGVSILDLHKVDIVLFNQAIAVIAADQMAGEPLEPANETIH